jgi:hypothetical protein
MCMSQNCASHLSYYTHRVDTQENCFCGTVIILRIKLKGQCRVLLHADYETGWKRVYVQAGREIGLQLHRLVSPV